MSAAAARTVPTEKTLREYAEALAARGHVKAAAELIDAHLAQHDAGWGLWNTFAVLSRKLGKHELAVTAYRASARQLEAAGHHAHAYAALKTALSLTPRDSALREEVARLSKLKSWAERRDAPTLRVEPGTRPPVRMVPAPLPSPPTERPIPPPIPARLRPVAARMAATPAKVARSESPVRSTPAPRPAAPRAVLPLRPPSPLKRQRPLECVTDPHIAIFDILDDEARRAKRRAR